VARWRIFEQQFKLLKNKEFLMNVKAANKKEKRQPANNFRCLPVKGGLGWS